jgi:putative endonuclease
MPAFVYMMSNRRNGILYIGVTTNLPKRSFQHREGVIEGFTRRYGLKMLVYYEPFDDVRDAIQREKTMKHWPRALESPTDPRTESGMERFVRNVVLRNRLSTRHGRACRGHPRLTYGASARKTWVAGTSPAMTPRGELSP